MQNVKMYKNMLIFFTSDNTDYFVCEALENNLHWLRFSGYYMQSLMTKLRLFVKNNFTSSSGCFDDEMKSFFNFLKLCVQFSRSESDGLKKI